jgi:dTDP-4-dehydrorhamnose reductase
MLPQIGDVKALDRRQLDLSRPEEIRRAFRTFRPSLVVNAAGYTAVDRAETDADAARNVNANAVTVIAQEAKKIGASIVHYSTDYVFDGSKTTPYNEDDAPNPLNMYGKTKLEAELAIQQSGVQHLIFRTSWIYSRYGRNFLLSILRLATEKEELRVVRDQLGAPTWSRDIASNTVKILSLLDGRDRGTLADVSGLYHMSAAGETSWHGFACAILAEATPSKTDVPWIRQVTENKPPIARRAIEIGSSDYTSLARRPAYSVLSNRRLAETFGIEMPPWREGLQAVFERAEGASGK